MRCFESDDEILSIDERKRSEEFKEHFIPNVYVQQHSTCKFGPRCGEFNEKRDLEKDNFEAYNRNEQ